MPPIEPNRPIDHAGPGGFAEVRLRLQQVYSERALRQIAQLKQQCKQTQFDIDRLKETVEGALPSRRAFKNNEAGRQRPGPGALGGRTSEERQAS